MHSNWIFWVVFNVFVLAMLALDLGVFHREQARGRHSRSHWLDAGLDQPGRHLRRPHLFLRAHYGRQQRPPNSQLSLEFVTGYLIEQSLSVDNLFVFLLIFRYFAVPRKFQHEVLFWGVLGALIMRAIFIAAGVTLLNRFHWIIYMFGAILIYSGIKLLRQHGAEIHPESNPLLRGYSASFSASPKTMKAASSLSAACAMTYATPLALVLIVVETTDLLFAVDSIPAVLAVTREPFIVYTSNVFAIMGLRSLYFALAGMIETLPVPALRSVADPDLDRREDAGLVLY